MSESPTATGPSPAYLEEVNEDSQTTISGSRRTANTAAKRSKDVKQPRRDAASDSGYSSHTATAGSTSQESKNGSAKNPLTRSFRRMMGSKGKSQSKEEASPPKATLKKPAPREQKIEKSRISNPIVEGREEAAKISLSGSAPEPKKTTKVHQPPARAEKAHSPTEPQPTVQGSTRAVPISQPPLLRVRTLPAGPYQNVRPLSFHAGGAPPLRSMHPTQVYQYHNVQPTMSLPTAFHPPPFHNPSPTYVSTPNRQITYNFPPTAPHYPGTTSQWPQVGYYPATSPSSYLPPSSIVNYPSVPPAYHRPRQHHTDSFSRRLSASSIDQHSFLHDSPEDEAVYLDDNSEAYYRRVMPPPPRPHARRPPMPPTASTSATAQRSHRNSVDSGSHSPNKRSLEESPPTVRPSASLRTSSSRNIANIVTVPEPPNALHQRPARPQSYHAGNDHKQYHSATDALRKAEHYQDTQKAHTRLTADAIKVINGQLVRVKSKSKGGSETASRASSSREGSDAKKRASIDRRNSAMADEAFKVRLETAQGMKIDVKGDSAKGRTIRFRESQHGDGFMEVSVGGARDGVKYRNSRPKESLRSSISERRYSVSARRGDTKKHNDEEGSGVRSTRRSSSRPVTRRESQGDSRKEHEERIKALREEAARHSQETPLVDDEEKASAKEVGAKEIDKAAPDRLRKLRTGSHSRRSSRSTVNRRNPAAVPPFVSPEDEGKPF